MFRFRSLAAFCLAIVLVCTSVTMAVARGQMRMTTATGTMLVICSGAGPMSITLDMDGNPVGPMHVCPDCALGMIADDVPPVSLPVPPATGTRISWIAQGQGLGARPTGPPQARGPPGDA
ncbi:MAG: hypothetical protein Q7J57_05950 [Gemmobacter sp.]|nr:hypothetical protein [Gemmobacter sp.]